MILENEDTDDFQHFFISTLPRGLNQHYERLVPKIGYWPKDCLSYLAKCFTVLLFGTIEC